MLIMAYKTIQLLTWSKYTIETELHITASHEPTSEDFRNAALTKTLVQVKL